MSYAGYEDIVNSMSDQKYKDDNMYFDVGSFDANNSSVNQTIQSGKKEDDFKASHKFSLNNINMPDEHKISESQEFIIEKNLNFNNPSKEGKISKNTESEKDILKEKEKEKLKENAIDTIKEKEKESSKIKEKEKVKEKEKKKY